MQIIHAHRPFARWGSIRSSVLEVFTMSKQSISWKVKTLHTSNYKRTGKINLRVPGNTVADTYLDWFFYFNVGSGTPGLENCWIITCVLHWWQGENGKHLPGGEHFCSSFSVRAERVPSSVRPCVSSADILVKRPQLSLARKSKKTLTMA